jgi:hypothetical protein
MISQSYQLLLFPQTSFFGGRIFLFNWCSCCKNKIQISQFFSFTLVVTATNPNWSIIPGKLTQLDVSPADIVWGVNRHHRIYISNGNGWHNVPGLLVHVTVGSAGVWGVNSGGNIYYREGVTLSSPSGASWTHIPGNFKFRPLLFYLWFD